MVDKLCSRCRSIVRKWLLKELRDYEELNVRTGLDRIYISDSGPTYDDLPEIACIKKLLMELNNK